MKLKGPSVAADAACASSLVALHQACHALANRDIDIAMVGGVNAILTPDVMISFMQSGLLSQDGHCRVFDARADGYVRAEACGVVAAKRLADAYADGDRILGVVRGVKLTQTGVRQSFIAPSNGRGSHATAWEAAEVSAAEIGYIEAHATGTGRCCG
jgi:acyl transferase domain-containing protein